jgi:hypothetical protein
MIEGISSKIFKDIKLLLRHGIKIIQIGVIGRGVEKLEEIQIEVVLDHSMIQGVISMKIPQALPHP